MSSGGVVAELFRIGFYKPTQGKFVRQLTFVALAVVCAFAAFSLSTNILDSEAQPVRVGVPFGLWLLLCWVAFRVVNLPQFAEFLISVESELDKVVWPGRKQVMQSTVVVIVTMLFLGAFLFGVDFMWRWLFTKISFIEY
jgi:preprotein translocase subunit SecE